MAEEEVGTVQVSLCTLAGTYTVDEFSDADALDLARQLRDDPGAAVTLGFGDATVVVPGHQIVALEVGESPPRQVRGWLGRVVDRIRTWG